MEDLHRCMVSRVQGLLRRQYKTEYGPRTWNTETPRPYIPWSNFSLEKYPTVESGIEPGTSWSKDYDITTEPRGRKLLFFNLKENITARWCAWYLWVGDIKDDSMCATFVLLCHLRMRNLKKGRLKEKTGIRIGLLLSKSTKEAARFNILTIGTYRCQQYIHLHSECTKGGLGFNQRI